MIELSPISIEDAKAIFEKHSAYRGEFTSAISAKETVLTLQEALRRIEELQKRIAELEASGQTEITHGVIALNADGKTFALGHIYTDASAQIGSLLYGGAWRVAKASGYKTITI